MVSAAGACSLIRNPTTAQEKIVRLIASDGLSINSLINSEIMRELFSNSNQNLPKSSKTIVQMIKNFYEEVKLEVRLKIKNYLENGNRYSGTTDEWSSIRRRHYLNVNIHSNTETINLGLCRVEGRCDAGRLKLIIQSRLLDNGLFFSRDLAGTTSDGCNLMKKFGKDSGIEFHICDLHTLHLGTCDFFYKEERSEVGETEELETSNEDSDSDSEETIQGVQAELVESSPKPIRKDIRENLDAVRKVIKYFRKSEPLNCALQKNLKQELGKELELLLDFKTRWSTIPTMINRFLECKNAIWMTLSQLERMDLAHNINIELLRDLSVALEPVRLATLRIEERNTTVVDAELITEMLCNTLAEIGSDISKELGECIYKRHVERRNKPLVSLLRYLNNPKFSKNSNLFEYSSKNTIHAHAKEIMRRLFPDQYESEDEEIEENKDNQKNLSFIEQMNVKLAKETHKRPKISSSFQKELNLFETTGTRTNNLDKLYQALSTIQASSAEAERTFSMSAKFCTKIRSRLSDEVLNMLVFLKHWFKNK